MSRALLLLAFTLPVPGGRPLGPFRLVRVGAARDGDLCGLFDHGAVLAGDRGRHLQRRLAKVAVGSQSRMWALGKDEVKCVDRRVED